MAETPEVMNPVDVAGTITLVNPNSDPQVLITMESHASCIIMAGFIGDLQMEVSPDSLLETRLLAGCTSCGADGLRIRNKTDVPQDITLSPCIRDLLCGDAIGKPLPLTTLHQYIYTDDRPFLAVTFSATNGTDTASITLVVQVGVDP